MPSTRSDYAQRLGLAGLYLFAVSGALNQGGVYSGLGLMLLGAALQWGDLWRGVRRQPAFVLAWVITLYVIAQGLATYLTVDTPAGKLARHVWNLVAVGGLFSVVTAWWLAGDPSRIARVLQLALLGFSVGVLKGVDWAHFATYVTQRPLFGMGNGAGLYALVAMAGLLMLRSSRLFDGNWSRRGLTPLTRKLLLLLLLLLCAAVVVLSQTRAVWLAALLVAPVAIIVIRRARHETTGLRMNGFEALLLAVLALGIFLGFGTIEKRLDQEQGDLIHLFSGNAGLSPGSSVGQRIYLWRDAVGRIEKRPFFGWGAGSAQALIRGAAVPGGLSHYHNLYLQLAVELGVLGLGLFMLWFLVIARAAVLDCRDAHLGAQYGRFLLVALTIFLVASFFQIRHDDERGQYLLILLGALALTCRLGRAQERPPAKRPGELSD